MKGSNFFSLLVVGDNPKEMVEPYNVANNVETYVKYKFDDAAKLKKVAIKVTEKILDAKNEVQLSDMVSEYLEDRLNALKHMTDFEYYSSLTMGMEYDENGNALATENPNGKWKTCEIGKHLCVPFRLKTGEDVFEAKVKDVDWEYMNNGKAADYELVWKLLHNEKEATTDKEKQIVADWATHGKYLSQFDSMEQFVTYSSSYFTNAILDTDGWQDMTDSNTYVWIANFYRKFISRLDPETQLTVFECTK